MVFERGELWPSYVVALLLWVWTVALLVVLAYLTWTSCRSVPKMLLCCAGWKGDRTCFAGLLGRLGLRACRDELGIDAQLEALADARRLDRVRGILKWGVPFMPYLIYRNIISANKLIAADDNQYLLHRGTLFFWVPLEVMGVLFHFRPDTLTKAALQACYAAVMTRSIYSAIRDPTIADGDRLFPPEYAVVLTQLFRLWFGLLLQNIQWTVALHLVVVPSCITIYALHQRDDIVVYAVMEVFFAGLVCVSCASFESSTRASIIANLHAESAKALEGAAEAMLSSVCDAVVHLSSSLLIKEPCPRLSTLLLKDPSFRWQGRCFGDLFMHETDVSSFKSFVGKGQPNLSNISNNCKDTVARTIHATLCDVYGDAVLVQLFHTMCLGIDGREVHIIGVRDVGEERIGPLPAASSSQPGEAPRQILPQQSSQKSLSTISESAFSSEEASVSAIPMEMGTPWDTSTVKVSVRVEPDTLPITRYTSAFVSMVGAEAGRRGADLLDLVPSARAQEKLLRGMLELANELSNAEEGAAATLQIDLATKRLGTIRVDTLVRLDWDLELEALADDRDVESEYLIDFQSFRALGVRGRVSGHRRSSRSSEARRLSLALEEPGVEAPVASERRSQNLLKL